MAVIGHGHFNFILFSINLKFKRALSLLLVSHSLYLHLVSNLLWFYFLLILTFHFNLKL